MTDASFAVTEQEIQRGILNASNVADRVLCYARNLEDLRRYLDKQNTRRFIDTVEQEEQVRLDAEAQQRLSDLKVNKIPRSLGGSTARSYDVKWLGVNLEDSEDVEHRRYLQEFSQQFVADMKTMINKHLQNKDGDGRAMLGDDVKQYEELVHHARFAHAKLALFCGREETLEQLRTLLTRNTTSNTPIVIHALSGHGKTSLLAKCASLIPAWLPSCDTAVVLRFLGTSPRCSNIRDTLLSVIHQLTALIDYTLPADEDLEKMGQIRAFFNELIDDIGRSHSARRFVIILDSIDQLADLYGAHRFVWLPRALPANVHIVISLLSDYGSLLANCRHRVTDTSCYIGLEPLSSDTARDIMLTYLSLHKRTLTSRQQVLVLDYFRRNAQPLYLKLVLDRALQWSSYTPLEGVQMPVDVRGAIKLLFDDMKNKYGEVSIDPPKHASYIECLLHNHNVPVLHDFA